MNGRIKVLVVDDSAFARKVVRESLESDAAIDVVGIARDGLEALEKIGELSPDVITLDLVMPNLDGVGVLNELSVRKDAPRSVVVSVADGESELGAAALRAGATELVHKPTALATSRLYEIKDELIRKVKLAAKARWVQTAQERAAAVGVPLSTAKRLVAIGTSTGGPQAVSRLLESLPASFPVPLVVVIHMPAGYTGPYAKRLDQSCALEVLEAQDGQVLSPGTALIAPAGEHLVIEQRGANLVARLRAEPADVAHRPSVDVLFESLVPMASKVVAVVLTGMGDDGTRGARLLANAGGVVLAEAETSCVVYGMPRSVKEAGAMTAEAPLGEMPDLITQHL